MLSESMPVTMEKVYQRQPCLPSSTSRYASTTILSASVSSLVSNSSPSLAMPSRLPQRGGSRIPGPGQSTPSTPVTTINSSASQMAPTIAPPKKFLSPPSKLSDSSLRSVSPATVFKCKSAQSSSVPSISQSPSVSSPTINNVNENGRGIRPPRSSIVPSPSTPNGTLTKSINSKTSLNKSVNGLTSQTSSINRTTSGLRSTLREVKEESEVRRSRAPSLGPTRGSRQVTGSLNGLSNNRSDSTPSLSENDSGSERRSNKGYIKPNHVKSHGLGIPSPKSRPNSMCLDNSQIATSIASTAPNSNSSYGLNTTPSKTGKSGLRPLSSSGIPKTGLSGYREPIKAPPKALEETQSDKRLKAANESAYLAATRSEPNVARVSPIRRSMGQSGTASDAGNTSVRPGSGFKEDQYQVQPEPKINGSGSGLPELLPTASTASTVPQVTSNETSLSSKVSICPPPPPRSSSPQSKIISKTASVLTAPSSSLSSSTNNLASGLSSVSRAQPTPASPSPSSGSTSSSTLKPVIEETPLSSQSAISIDNNKGNHFPPSTKIIIDNQLNDNKLCNRLNHFTSDNSDRPNGSDMRISSSLSYNLSESSHPFSNGSMSPVYEDESCSNESTSDTKTNIDISNMKPPSVPGYTLLNGLSSSTSTSVTNLTTAPNVSASALAATNLLNQINRRNKCTLPSEAELSFKADLRPGLSGQGPFSDIISLAGFTGTIPQPPSPPTLLPISGTTVGSSLTNQAKRLSRNGELRGSTISLLSGSSSFSATEERHNQEVKKLRDDLNRANSKVETLTQQLKNSNEMIQTFGKSLETLRSRLHQCSLSTDQKDREIARLKTTIEVLRRECQNGETISNGSDNNNQSNGHHHYLSSNSDIELSRRDKATIKKRLGKEPRSPSCDRDGDSSGPSGWFKGSIQRAFKKTRSRNKSGGSASDAEGIIKPTTVTSAVNGDSSSLPSTPLNFPKNDPFLGINEGSHNNNNNNESVDFPVKEENELIEDLKKQLREKEKQLNEIRLEALLTASQMETLNDRINKMNKEISLLRSENHRLQCLLQRQSIASSVGSLTSCFEAQCNNNNTNNNNNSSSTSSSSSPGGGIITGMCLMDRRIPIKLGSRRVGLLQVNPRLTWDQLDDLIRRIFDCYLRKIDAERLEMRSTSLISYSFGNERFERKLGHDKCQQSSTGSSSSLADQSPVDFLSRNNYVNLYLRNKLEYLSIETSTPKSVLEKITNHLRESRRLIICGPPNCGKSFIALKCCQFLLEEYCMDCATGIASISVRETSEKEIECFLSNVLTCDELSRPKAIVFKGIQKLINFAQLLKPIRGIHSNNFPLLLCTMRGVNTSTTNLQIYHNFRSLIYNQSSEPCKSLLSRVLRKKAVDSEIDAVLRGFSYNFSSITNIIDWLQQLFHHLNLFLETFSSPLSPHNLGPSIFFSCPLDVETSQEWFVDTWNFTIVPNIKRIIEEFKPSSSIESLPSVGQDPLDWIKDNWPWIDGKESLDKLSSILDSNQESGCKLKVDSITDQLHNTLLRLQEATKA